VKAYTYHDASTARIALELLVPMTDLRAVAVEGFSTEDAQIASASTTETAASFGTMVINRHARGAQGQVRL
jgi:hypothetical protein